jgi:glycosyltransferase involved in cell wall biosynthesis
MTGGKLNVLHVCDRLGPEGSSASGVTRLLAWMMPRFDPARFNVSLVSLGAKGLSEQALESSGVDISCLHKSSFDPAALTALLKVVDRKSIDVLHLHGYAATTFGRAAAAMRRLPAVVHQHAGPTAAPWFQKAADRALGPFTDVALAGSKDAAELLVRARFIPADKVTVMHPGAPFEVFSRERSPAAVAAARTALGVAPGDFAIGAVAPGPDADGNGSLADAARLVLDVRPDATFIVLGAGPLRGDLEAQAARLKLDGRFVFTGFAGDMAGALSAFDLVVFPAQWEGAPLTAFEALAAGKPIVAADGNGLSELLRHDHDARFVPNGNARALADQIVALMEAPGERARLSANAQATGRRCDIGAFVRKMERLYTILHDVSRRTRRRGVLEQDLSFLKGECA